MQFLKRYSIVLFISLLLFLIIINIFKSIFMAQELIFPYAITKFDIVSQYPLTWKYIKIIYCVTCFFNLFLCINSIFKFTLTKKINLKYKNQTIINSDHGKINLLIGTNALSQNIYIPEKGLYQNILITGTIGSRKNCILYVSVIKSIT